jgi:hypothetical protein
MYIYMYIQYILCVCAESLTPPASASATSCHVTWHPRFHGYSIAHLQVAHLASHGTHGAGAFVAHLTAVALVEALLTSRISWGMGEKNPLVVYS